MTKLCFHGEDVVESSPEEALFYFIPAPLEQSVSYAGGTANGPEAILRASEQLELLENNLVPSEQGLYTSSPISCTATAQEALAAIEEEVGKAIAVDSLPVLLGGEHTVSLGAVKALKRKYGTDFAVVQFDAHADLRDSYTGTKLSHASVMRRVHELGVPVYQLGTRSYSQEEDLYRREHNIWYCDGEDICRQGVVNIKLPDDCPENVYISFDVDAWDTSLMPATGTPVPGGLDWYQSVWLLEMILSKRSCIGMDFVELAPISGMHGYDFAVAQLIHRVMSFVV